MSTILKPFDHSSSLPQRVFTAFLTTFEMYLTLSCSVSYRSLRSIWHALPPSDRPDLHHLFKGADFVFSSPKPREKSEELKARLRKLAELSEKGIPGTGEGHCSQEASSGAFLLERSNRIWNANVDSRFQVMELVSLHVVLIMFTGYLVGFSAFRALFNHSAVMNTAGGILGMVCGMLLETVLFIIRTSSKEVESSNSLPAEKKFL
ncbi:hypothetical protein ZIOFF_003155 [Zingiber officinale]|uniref:Uncharacterized protein n=1 Tax=Zingiber officinale TaxID=94328 RepID=A0A8J5MA01_ZINOF|nr:hypothetical protein ZIOFF_003155 [Zingiber officinale]